MLRLLAAKSLQSCLALCDPIDYALQASLSMGFSRQEYWSGLPFPPPGDLPHPGIELNVSWGFWIADGFFTAEGKPCLLWGTHLLITSTL